MRRLVARHAATGTGGRVIIDIAVVAVALGVLHLAFRRRSGGRRRGWVAQDLTAADACSPAEFELLVADLLARDGCLDAAATGKAGDRGADAVGRLPTRRGWLRRCAPTRRIVAQCKHYAPSNHVGDAAVQAFLGTVWDEHGADIGLIVTTSWFTPRARELGVRRGLTLVDRDLLAEWIGGAWTVSAAEVHTRSSQPKFTAESAPRTGASRARVAREEAYMEEGGQ